MCQCKSVIAEQAWGNGVGRSGVLPGCSLQSSVSIQGRWRRSQRSVRCWRHGGTLLPAACSSGFFKANPRKFPLRETTSLLGFFLGAIPFRIPYLSQPHWTCCEQVPDMARRTLRQEQLAAKSDRGVDFYRIRPKG